MRTVLIIIFLLSSVACTNPSKIPEGIYPKEKMENILWDMMLADRYSAQFLLKDSSSIDVKLETMKLYEQVFQVNKTTHAEFVKSFKYYLNRPDISKIIFDSLSVRGNRNRDSLFKKM